MVGKKLDTNGKSEGTGRLVILDATLPVNQVVDRVKAHVGLLQVQVAYPSFTGDVQKVAVYRIRFINTRWTRR